MLLSVGQGYFILFISFEKFNVIKESVCFLELSLWEKIKVYFFIIYYVEVFECIFNFYYYQELNLILVQVCGVYIKF